MLIEIEGRAFTVDESTAYRGFWADVARGRWEPETLRAISRLLDEGDVFIDVGAWVGPTALFAASCGAVVHAYEPDPVALDGLRRNIDLNPGLAGRVTVHPVALAEQAGIAELAADEFGQSVSSLMKRRGARQEIQVRALSEEAKSSAFRDAHVVKVDIEGAEYRILAELSNMLGGDARKVLILSTHINYMRDRIPEFLPRLVRRLVLQVLALGQLRVPWKLREVRYWYAAVDAGWVKIGLARRLWMFLSCREKEFILAGQPQPLT